MGRFIIFGLLSLGIGNSNCVALLLAYFVPIFAECPSLYITLNIVTFVILFESKHNPYYTFGVFLSICIKMPDFERKLASGAIAGVIGTTIIYPLDIIKTKLQSGNSPNIKNCIKEIASTGISGFYRGIRANLIGIIPEKAIKLAVNHQFRQYFADKQNIDPERLGIQYGMISGGMAGLCQVVATNVKILIADGNRQD